MQMGAPPQRWGKTAFLYGLISGVILAIVQFLLLLPRTGAGGFWIDVLLGLVAPFVIGILVSRKTRSVGAGSVAGLWMALFCGILVIAAFSVRLAIAGSGGAWDEAMQSLRNNPDVNPDQAGGLVIGVLIFFAIIYLLGILGGGAGLGALGGLIGKSMAKPVAPPYPFYPQAYSPGYPPMPQSSYPQPPTGQPSYPPPPLPYTEYSASYPPPDQSSGAGTPPPPPPGS